MRRYPRVTLPRADKGQIERSIFMAESYGYRIIVRQLEEMLKDIKEKYSE